MFTILLPSDFSQQSENIMAFAAKITNNLSDFRLILFHSIYIHGITPNMLKEIEDILIKEASHELQNITEKLNKTYKLNVKPEHKIVFGNPVATILDFSKEQKIDLVLMSRHTTGRLEKALVGSNTLEVLNHITCPVLIVPDITETQRISEIAYATNLENLEDELYEILPILRLFNAKLTVVHIYPEAISGSLFDIKKLTDDITKEMAYDNITFYFSMNNDVVKGLESFIQQNKPDLLVFYTKHRGFWQGLYDKSLTQEMALNENVPLLAIPQNEQANINEFENTESSEISG
jgi:nucleotide-binding universal stress UspA family protein